LILCLCFISCDKTTRNKKVYGNFILPEYDYILASGGYEKKDSSGKFMIVLNNNDGYFISLIGKSNIHTASSNNYKDTIILDKKIVRQEIFNWVNIIKISNNNYTVFQVDPEYQYISVDYDSKNQKVRISYYNMTGEVYF